MRARKVPRAYAYFYHKPGLHCMIFLNICQPLFTTKYKTVSRRCNLRTKQIVKVYYIKFLFFMCNVKNVF